MVDSMRGNAGDVLKDVVVRAKMCGGGFADDCCWWSGGGVFLLTGSA